MSYKPPPNAIRVKHFPNLGLGCFYGTTQRGVDSRPEGYDRSVNAWVGPDFICPSFAPALTQTLSSKAPPVEVVPGETSTGTPNAVVLYGNAVKLFQNGGVSDETDATADDYANAALFVDDQGGGSPAWTLYASTKTGNKRIQRRSQSGTWTETSGTNALLVVAAGKDFYRAVNDFQVKKYDGAGNVYTDAEYGSAYNIGTAASKFTAANAVDDRPVFGKTDGKLYAFDIEQGQYVPIYSEAPLNRATNPKSFLAIDPDGRGGIRTYTHDGAIVHISRFGEVTTEYPRSGKTPSAGTPKGRIVRSVPFADDVLLYMSNMARIVQTPGLKIVFYDSSETTYTDYTTEATDQRQDTVINIGGMEIGDYLYVGADVQFFLIDFTIGTASSANARLQLAFGTAGDNFLGTIQQANLFDGTNSTPTADATPWGQSGQLTWRHNANMASWANTTPSFLGTAKYWMRIGLV